MMKRSAFWLSRYVCAGIFGCAALFSTMLAAQAQCLSRQDARAIVETGQVLAPGQISALVRGYGAKLVALELCASGSGYVYLLRVVTRAGQVREVTVDANSGNLGTALE